MLKKERFLSLCLCMIGILLIAEVAQARSFGRMRQSARITRSNVSKSVGLKIRPRLNISKVAAGPVSSLAISRDEKMLVTVVDSNKLRLWDLSAGREIGFLESGKKRIVDLAFSPDSLTCIYNTSDGAVFFWDIKTLAQRQCLSCPPSGRVAILDNGNIVLGTLKGELVVLDKTGAKVMFKEKIDTKPFTGMVVNEDGEVLVGTKDEILIVRPQSGAAPVAIPTRKTPVSMAVSQNVLGWGMKSGHVVLWDLKTNQKIRTIEGMEGAVTSLDINKPKNTIIGATEDGIVYKVAVSSGDPVEMGRHDKQISFTRMDADAGNALTASNDGTCKLWNLESRQLMLTLVSAKDGWAVVDKQGRFDGTQAALEGIDWQDGEHVLNINSFSEKYYEPNLFSRTLQKDQGLGDVSAIPEGIHLAATVEIQGKSPDRKKALVKVIGMDNQGSGVRDVKLYQNGKRVPDELGKIVKVSDKEDQPELIKEYTVELGKGENSFTALAINEESLESDPAELVLTGGDAGGERTVWVVTVGVNKYQIADLNLDYARPDAQSLYDYFKKQKNLAVTDRKLVHLFDETATREGILNIFNALKHIPREDIVVVYMAGHGVIVGEKWYFLPHNIPEPSEEAVVANGISTQELKGYIESVGADRVVFLIDACQSGGALSPIKNFQGIKSLRMLARDLGVHILAATDREQFAVELASLGHGVFTYALLEALNGKAKTNNTQLTVREIMKFVEREVPALSKKYANYAQFPVSHSRGHDFQLVEK